MKIAKIALLSSAALGTLLATSCCSSKPAPQPAAPSYVAPAK